MSAAVAFDASRLSHHKRRKLVNQVALALSLAAMAFGVFWLIWILIETVRLGIGGLSLAVFTEMTPPPLAETGGRLYEKIFSISFCVFLLVFLFFFFCSSSFFFFFRLVGMGFRARK